jgi:3-phenylpropionate/trans-cinnamate dioxygenase ferredoxin subunit
MLGVEVDGRKIVLVNLDGEVHALDGICSHAYSELTNGFFAGDLLTCALHLSQFDVRTGEPISPPATDPIAKYAVVVEGDTVYVEISS